jgi:hypothetical protein
MTGSHFTRIGVSVSALAAAALTLTACGGAANSGGGSAGGSGTPSQTLNIGYDSDPAAYGGWPAAGGARQG